MMRIKLIIIIMCLFNQFNFNNLNLLFKFINQIIKLIIKLINKLF